MSKQTTVRLTLDGQRMLAALCGWYGLSTTGTIETLVRARAREVGVSTPEKAAETWKARLRESLKHPERGLREDVRGLEAIDE